MDRCQDSLDEGVETVDMAIGRLPSEQDKGAESSIASSSPVAGTARKGRKGGLRTVGGTVR
jgi:hypothetical protein